MRLGRIVFGITGVILSMLVVNAQERSRTIEAPMVSESVEARMDPSYIPADSKVYVADIDGMPHFEINLMAAFQKKKVRLVLVTDRPLADFEITGFAKTYPSSYPGIFGNGLPESEASIQVVNLKTGVIAYAVASYKVNSPNGNKSTAEHMAKNLRQKMERDDKRFKK